jgi:dephospho-CoA kinase
MKIIAITGMPCSGKGEAADYLKGEGVNVMMMSDSVRKEMEGKGIETNNKNFREYATGLRKEKGMDVVAKMCLPYIRELYGKLEVLIIDGVRSNDEAKLFKKELSNDFVLVAIFAPPKLRYERTLKRGKPSDGKTWEEFAWRDEVEMGWGLGNVIALADYTIDNSGSMEELHKKIDALLSKITG